MARDWSKKAQKANEESAKNERARARARKEQVPPVVRSPALESAEKERAQDKSAKGAARPAPRPRRDPNSVRYAAEETLARPALPRKSLPRQKNIFGRSGTSAASVGRQSMQRSGLTAAWRHRNSIGTGIDETMGSGNSGSPVASAPREVEFPGISEEEKKKLAELEMRLPRVAGKIDAWLLIVVIALISLGLIMVYSSSSFIAAQSYGDASYFFQKQLLWVIIGIPVMLITMRIDYRRWRRFSLIGLLIVVPMLILVLKFGTTTYGASRWFRLGFASFQPSEFAKLVLALYIADWLARKGKQVGTFLYGLAPFIIFLGVILGLVLLENDMGTAIIIAGLAAAMFFTAGANITQFLLAMGCGGLVFFLQAIFKAYRYVRLIGFLNPFKGIYDINLQLYQSLLALGSGGLFGVGLGASRQKTGYLPFPYSDSIFAILGEELGFIGCALVIALFLFLAFRGFRLARRTQDIYGALLATGITTWLVLQALINIGASTGSIPYTGVPLPFISFGGSSLVISMGAIGVLLNISRYIQEPEVPALSRRTIAIGKNTIARKTKKRTGTDMASANNV